MKINLCVIAPVSIVAATVLALTGCGSQTASGGGRRLVVIPGDQAYGANPPQGSGHQPNEPLVFVVDLVSIP